MKKESVISYFGDQVKVASALLVKQPTVSGWPAELPYSVLGRIAVLQPKAWSDLSAQADWSYLRDSKKVSSSAHSA